MKQTVAQWKQAGIRSVMAVLAVLLLGSCGQADCVAADDWGYPKIDVPAHYDPGEVRGAGTEDSPQIVAPVDSGRILIDAERAPLVVTIGDGTQWTSWFGGSDDIKDDLPWDPIRSVPDRECQYFVNSGSPLVNTKGDIPTLQYDPNLRYKDDLAPKVSKARRYTGDIHAPEYGAKCPAPGVVVQTPDQYTDCRVPCYMRYGMGLYVGFSQNDTPDSVVVTHHIPDAKYPEVPYNIDINVTDAANRSLPQVDADNHLLVITDTNNPRSGQIPVGQGRDGYLIRGYPSVEIPGVQTHDRLFFKIVDTRYTDNFGFFTVSMKEGTRSAKSGPIESVVSTILTPIFKVMERLWTGLVQNSGFIGLVRIAIELAVTIYALTYMMGMISVPKNDFIINVVRLGIVIQLLSPGSFDFFYNHFFKAFLDGIADIVGFIINPFTDYDPNSPWYSLDQLLHKLWSKETHAKLFSTLFSNAVGFMYIVVFYIALVLFLVAVVKAVLRYIAAMIVLAILVIMGPIFITLMLYGKTRTLFDEWVNQFLAVAIELLLLFAAVGMFAYFIVFFMEQTLGYRVCFNTVFKFDILDQTLLELKFWMPDIRYDMEHFGPIWTDANNNGIRGINEFANRYYDLPYFDILHDKAKIVTFASEKNFLNFSDILLFIGIIFLMDCFLDYIPHLANAMKGATASASGSVLTPGAGGGAMWDSAMKAAFGAPNSASASMKNVDDKGKPLDPKKQTSTRFGAAISKFTGRDGGVLGGMIRGVWDVGAASKNAYNKGITSAVSDGFKNVKGGAGGAVAGFGGLKPNPNYGQIVNGKKDTRQYISQGFGERLGLGALADNLVGTANADNKNPIVVERPKTEEPKKPPVPEAAKATPQEPTLPPPAAIAATLIEEHAVRTDIKPGESQMFSTDQDLWEQKQKEEAKQKALLEEGQRQQEEKKKLEEEAKNIKSKLSPSLNIRELSDAELAHLFTQYGARLSQADIDNYKKRNAPDSSARNEISAVRPPLPPSS